MGASLVNAKEKVAWINEHCDEVLLADGFEEALLGVGTNSILNWPYMTAPNASGFFKNATA